MSSVEAVGAYLSVLRERRGLKHLDVIRRIWEIAPELKTVNPNYVWRIESGKIKSPGAQLLMAFTRAVQGNPDHVSQLLLTTDATKEDGEHLAESFLSQDDEQQIAYLVRTYGADRVAEIFKQVGESDDFG
jgi:transcriptional regulator with XRE-family HTH domain